MQGSSILDVLSANNVTLDKVAQRLDSLRLLFSEAQEEKLTLTVDGFIYSDTVKAKTIYQNEDVTVTIGEWALNGDVWPEHKHEGSLEYLIVTKGKIILTVGNVTRVMKKGECASLPIGVVHSAAAVEDGTSLIGICIPPEKAYLMETLQCLTSQEKS